MRCVKDWRSVCVDAPSGQDPSDRVRPRRSRQKRRERRGLSRSRRPSSSWASSSSAATVQRKGGFLLKRKSRRRPHAGEAERRSRKACESAGMNRRLDKGNGLPAQVVQGWSRTTTRRAFHQHSRCSVRFRFNVVDLWRRARSGGAARRTSRHGKGSKVSRVNVICSRPLPRSSHPWPSPDRFRVKHPRSGSQLMRRNPARTDLSGGRSAMDVPTAIEPRTSGV